MKSPAELAAAIRDAALALGFARVGFTPIEAAARGQAALGDWLERGYHGEMAYMAEPPRGDPRVVLAEARTLVVVALPYPREAAPHDGELRGTVARYARGEDYHVVMRDKLRALVDACGRIAERPVLARHAVDTAPLLEREGAARSGVGFIAKSTMAIAPGLGTYFVLGEVLLDVEVAPDAPIEPRCGSCTACLDACPTRAFVGPYVLDARRCISYLTIELRGAIPRELRPLVGMHVFGCDICQEVCPFNASPKVRPSAPELAPRPELAAPLLEELLFAQSSAHKRRVVGTALRRTRPDQLARNAAVALGNSGDARAVAPLDRALREHKVALVRAHAAWGLGRLGGGREALAYAAAHDEDESVREEATLALATLRY